MEGWIEGGREEEMAVVTFEGTGRIILPSSGDVEISALSSSAGASDSL